MPRGLELAAVGVWLVAWGLADLLAAPFRYVRELL